MLTGFRERISHDVVNLLAAPEYKKLQADPPLLAYSQYSHAQSHMRPRITTRTTRTAARMRSTAHDRTHARTHARMRIHSCMRARKRTLTDAPCARSLAYGQPKRRVWSAMQGLPDKVVFAKSVFVPSMMAWAGASASPACTHSEYSAP